MRKKKKINKRLWSNTAFLDSREEVKNLGSGNTAQIPQQSDKQILPQQSYISTLECAQARANSDDNDGRWAR